MSGPKVDEFELMEMERARLEEERRKRLRLASGIQQMIDGLGMQRGNSGDLLREDSQFGEKYDALLKKEQACRNELNEYLEIVKRGNEQLDLQEIEKRAMERVLQFEQDTRDEIQEIKNLEKKFSSSSKQFQKIEEEGKKLAEAKRQTIMRISLLKTEGKDAEKETVSPEEIREQCNAFQEEIKEFISLPMTNKHKNSVLYLHQDLQELEKSDLDSAKKGKRVKRLFEEYEKLKALIKHEMEGITEVYEEYKRECFDLDIPILKLNDFSDVKEIKEAIKNIKEKAEARLAKDYIRRQIDDLMQKHGYDVIQSDLLKESPDSGQVLYGVDDSTAISVFVSDENQLTMRVVGVGFDSEISEEENERLYREQCAFCSLHPQITKELEMRGIILRSKKHLPPDRKFNKKLVTKSKNIAQSKSRAKKELKKQELKTLHKE